MPAESLCVSLDGWAPPPKLHVPNLASTLFTRTPPSPFTRERKLSNDTSSPGLTGGLTQSAGILALPQKHNRVPQAQFDDITQGRTTSSLANRAESSELLPITSGHGDQSIGTDKPISSESEIENSLPTQPTDITDSESQSMRQISSIEVVSENPYYRSF
jgi:hypothetical protein